MNEIFGISSFFYCLAAIQAIFFLLGAKATFIYFGQLGSNGACFVGQWCSTHTHTHAGSEGGTCFRLKII